MALGSDIAGVTTVDRAMTVVEGRLALVQAILRRLDSPRGSLWYDPVYGYDIGGLIGSTEPASIIEHRVREQVMAEEEVVNCKVDATRDFATGALSISISVTDGDGPFTLTIEQADQETKFTAEALADGVIFFKQAA